MGDSGVGSNAVATHNTCIAAGAEAIVHTGDLDYQNCPTNWENFINARVGANYPYFYVLGNHDTSNASGYRANAEARFNRIGITSATPRRQRTSAIRPRARRRRG